MTYSASLDRLLNYWNSNDFNSATNPGGLAAGGHRAVTIGVSRNFDVVIGDQATVASEVASRADAAIASGAINASSSDTETPSVTTITWTVQTAKAFRAGMRVKAVSRADLNNYGSGPVTSYDSGTGDLVVSVDTVGTAAAAASDWDIYTVLEFASQAEAEAGTNESKFMNPLRVAEAIAAQVGDTILSWRSVTAATALSSADAGVVIGADGTFTITVAPTALGTPWNGRVRNVGTGIVTLAAGSGGTATDPTIGAGTALDLYGGDSVLMVRQGHAIQVGDHTRGSDMSLIIDVTANTASPIAAFDVTSFPASANMVVIMGNGLWGDSAWRPCLFLDTATAGAYDSAQYYGQTIKQKAASIGGSNVQTANIVILDDVAAAGSASLLDFVITIHNFQETGTYVEGRATLEHASGIQALFDYKYSPGAKAVRIAARPDSPSTMQAGRVRVWAGRRGA